MALRVMCLHQGLGDPGANEGELSQQPSGHRPVFMTGLIFCFRKQLKELVNEERQLVVCLRLSLHIVALNG